MNVPMDHYKPLGHHFAGNNDDNAVSRPKFESVAHEQSRNNVRPMSPYAVFLYSEYILRLYLLFPCGFPPLGKCQEHT